MIYLTNINDDFKILSLWIKQWKTNGEDAPMEGVRNGSPQTELRFCRERFVLRNQGPIAFSSM